jgi:hypothetical protein
MELSPFSEAASRLETQEFPNVYGTGRFIIVFPRALHWSLSGVRSIQFISSPLISYPFSLAYALYTMTYRSLRPCATFLKKIIFMVSC